MIIHSFYQLGRSLCLMIFLSIAFDSHGAMTDQELAKQFRIPLEQIQQLHIARGFSAESLERLPLQKLPRVLRRLQYLDLPYARAAFRILQEKDERKQIPPNALSIAVKQLREMRIGISRTSISGVPVGIQVASTNLLPPTAGLHANHSGWQSLGPGNIGGRTRSIIIHPNHPDEMWVGSVGGGVWHTTDGGCSFAPVNDFMANLAISYGYGS